MTDDQPPKKRRLRWWWAVAILPVLLIALALIVAFLPHIVTGERLRIEAVSALTEALGAPVQIDRIEYDPLSGFDVEKVVIGPPPGFTDDVVSIDRVRIGYQLGGLFSRKLTVTELRLIAPVITVETRGGQRNVDAILAHLARGDEDEPDPTGDGEPGPLLPLDVELGALELSPVTIRVTGEGPNASLSGVHVMIDGRAGRERLDAKLQLEIDPAGADNLTVSVPKDVTMTARLVEKVQLAVNGATSRGLALERVQLTIEGESRAAARWRDAPVPPVVLSHRSELLVEPAEDRLKISGIDVRLDGEPILTSHAELDGISAALTAFAGAPLTSVLADSIGLVDRKRSGTAELTIERAFLPLERIAPWVKLVIPELEIGGQIEVSPFVVAGTALDVASGTPAQLRLAARLTKVTASLPSAGISIGALDGSFEGSKQQGSGHQIRGSLAIHELAQADRHIERAQVELELALERLSYPKTGRTEAKVSVALSDAASPPVRVPAAEAKLRVAGVDPLAIDRDLDPIQVHAEVTAAGARVAGTSSSAIQLKGLAATVDAAIDRLLEPARAPITAKIGASIARATMADRSVERARVEVEAKLGDPRLGPFDAEASVEVKLPKTVAPPAAISDVVVKLSASAGQVALPALPRQVALRLSVAARAVGVSDETLGDVTTGLTLETALTADPVGGSVDVQKLVLAVEDILTVAVKGRGARLFTASPWVDAKLDVGPVRLDLLAAKIPAGLLKDAPDLTAQGTASLSLSAKGTVPKRFEETSLVNHPIEAHLAVELSDVGFASRKSAISMSDFDGKIRADVGAGKVETHTELSIARILQGRPPLSNQIDALTVENIAKLEGSVWTLGSHVRASSVRSAFGGEGAVEGASIDLDLTYPQHGDLELARFDVHAPGSGVELAMNGRLRRRAFGVFRPDLSVMAKLDLDRLRHLLPVLAGGAGKASFALKVDTRSDRVVDVEGRLEADKFSWEVPKVLTVLNASGRIPVSQRLWLPQPQVDDEAARTVGTLGDDFEARAAAMVDDLLNGRGLLETEDILVEAPRSADYQSLRPYYASSGARLTIDGIVFRQHAIEDVVLEGLWSSGVLRVDRLACRLWEGDVLGDLAVQFTPDQNVRVRLRGTMTDLNVDIPYSMAQGIEPATDASEKEDYQVSGQMDFEFALKQRAVNARVDLTKLSLPLVRRAFGALLLTDNPAMKALEIAQLAGVRPDSGKIWVSNNLLSVSFDWERLWVHASLDQESFAGKTLDLILTPFRFLLIPTLGGYVIKTVNETIRNFSISAVLDDVIGQARVEDQLRFLEGRVIAADRVPGGASGLPNEASADMLSPR